MSKKLKFSRYARSNVLLNRNIYYVRVTICEWLQNCLDVAPSSLDPSVGYILKPSVHEKAAETLIYEKRLKIGQKNCPKDFRNVPKKLPLWDIWPKCWRRKKALRLSVSYNGPHLRTPHNWGSGGVKISGVALQGVARDPGQGRPTNLGSFRILWSDLKLAKK